MTESFRATADRALHDARIAAFSPGDYVGQESFMTRGDILSLAQQAGIGAGVSMLDLCCGTAGPGRLITSELGCDYLGIDYDEAAITLAQRRVSQLPCRFQVARLPPIPAGIYGGMNDRIRGGNYEVVLLLETFLAFADKAQLVREVSGVLRRGGRLACTVEIGQPLTSPEQAAMPEADTVWPVPLPEFLLLLEQSGLRVRWQEDRTAAHADVVDALMTEFARHRSAIACATNAPYIDNLLASHRLWSDWLHRRRVRKIALVAERV